VPNDFVAELVAALSLALQGVAGVAVANSEPAEIEFSFEPAQNGAITLQVSDRHGCQQGKGHHLVRVSGSAVEVAMPFWRALKSLAGRVGPEAYAKEMQREFPSASLQRLSHLLGKPGPATFST
jgi:hypothetical protein